MELTKQDKRRIEEETDKEIKRIQVEASEYARMYEREYKTRLIEKLQMQIEASQYLAEHFKNKM